MRSVLVTGGAGYIGSHACKTLHAAGIQPVTYDNLKYGHPEAVKWGPLVRADLADRETLAQVFAEYQIDAVLHFAAYAYVGESVRDPGLYYENNVGGSLSLLRAMVKAKVSKIVFSSTCATYGQPQSFPMDERHRQDPINPYGNTKLVVERMLRDFETAHGIRSVVLRYFNASGADPSGDLFEDHDPETHLIPLAIQNAYGNNPDLIIFGEDYDTKDGTCVRDYVHVSDLAEAHRLALLALDQSQSSNIYNLGSGTGHSVREVLDAVERATGRKLSFKMGPRRMGDPALLVATSEKAKTQLQWVPRYQNLDEIVATAVQAYKINVLKSTSATS